ncbi:MAG: thiamine phosphate synthase [Kiloniellaceae bacterium]
MLLVSPLLDREGAVQAVEEALAVAAEVDIAALLLRGGGLDDAAFGRRLAPLLRAAQDHGIAVLLEDRPELLASSGADGLHLTLGGKGPRLKDLRARLGTEVILGAGCGASRHLAMTAGEQGADYVGFGDPEGAPEAGGTADPEMVAWWEAVMTPPQVAFGAADAAAAASLAAAGADFVAVGPVLWAAEGDPAAALRALRAALSQAPDGGL